MFLRFMGRRPGTANHPDKMNHANLIGSCVLRHCRNAGFTLLVGCMMPAFAQSSAADPGAAALAKEVASLGWILFSARTAQGDYDLFLSRPDGSARRNFTQTPDVNEFGGRFSPDSKRMLYRRQRRNSTLTSGKEVNHDLWGTQGALVIARADGSDPQTQGEEGAYPWASWSPDGTQIACLYKREGRIRIFDLGTKKLVKELPRQGIFQQLYWSPDGKHLFVNETFACRTTRYDLAADGVLTNPFRLNYPQDTYPDGMAFDAEGALWIACVISNRVIRVAPDLTWTIVFEDVDRGYLDRIASDYAQGHLTWDQIAQRRGSRVANLSSIAFGGPDLKTIYLGGLGLSAVQVLRSSVAGMPMAHW